MAGMDLQSFENVLQNWQYEWMDDIEGQEILQGCGNEKGNGISIKNTGLLKIEILHNYTDMPLLYINKKEVDKSQGIWF